MPNPNAIVTTVSRVERADARAAAEAAGGEREIAVELEGGRRVRLDAADPRSRALAGVLETIGQQRRPVYLELEPDSDRVREVRLPLASLVARLHLTGDGLLVELAESHARHLLRRGTADYDEMESALRHAYGARLPVLVTANDAGEIIDARPAARGGHEYPFPEPDLRPPPRTFGVVLRELLDIIYSWRCWPWWWFGCLTPRQAQQVFDQMAARTCDPSTVPVPCIPFLYPDDGCWARAHEMCRLMIAMGLSPRKVWIQSTYPALLHVDTANNPSCFVEWTWHVAPIVCVRSWPWVFLSRDMVIDPSLFTAPVTKAGWKLVQHDPTATLTDTDASIYKIFGMETDPTNAKTEDRLAYYRLQLQLRTIGSGPPPYAGCP
ncbi:MAG TPA: protein-glutamine glutaminase family protein [Longimicrobium sp.]|nr:protein-glutamine glutaminase family protein [Longimicrobium sp.]